jgi:hypothetical protein
VQQGQLGFVLAALHALSNVKGGEVEHFRHFLRGGNEKFRRRPSQGGGVEQGLEFLSTECENPGSSDTMLFSLFFLFLV